MSPELRCIVERLKLVSEITKCNNGHVLFSIHQIGSIYGIHVYRRRRSCLDWRSDFDILHMVDFHVTCQLPMLCIRVTEIGPILDSTFDNVIEIDTYSRSTCVYYKDGEVVVRSSLEIIGKPPSYEEVMKDSSSSDIF